MNRMNNKPLPETILDWFERNPTAKARSGPLAKAIKADATRVAQAMGNLADIGKLVRCKIYVPSEDRTPGAPEKQWEYALPAGGTALASVKPLKRKSAVRRDQLPGATATPRSKERDPLPTATPAPAPAPSPSPATIGETEQLANKLANTIPSADERQKEMMEEAIGKASPGSEKIGIEDSATTSSLAKTMSALISAKSTIAALQRQAMVDQDLIQSLKQRVASLEDQAASNDEKAGPLAATGYLVIVPKRKPRKLTKFETAQQAATIAANVAGRADVVALIPVGTARRETVKTSVWHKA